MANIKIAGASYSDVPSIEVPKVGENAGNVSFYDTEDADISANDIILGKKAYGANGPLIGTYDPSGGGGQTVYTSSTGLLYTAVMTIDLSMERASGYTIHNILQRYGDMAYLEDLTLTGIVRNASTGSMEITNGDFSTSHFPRLKKLKIQPTEVRNSSGNAYAEGDSAYNKLKIAHYAFNGTDLTELTLGKVGGPYLFSSGYYRNDLPKPPGTSSYQIGSESGLTLKIYVAAYDSKACFMTGPAPNTSVTQYDYTNGEVLTA